MDRAAVHDLAIAHEGRDFERAWDLHNKAADLGDPSSQHAVALLLSTGAFGAPREDEPLALLHEYFASLGDDYAAQVGLGYRHAMGLGVDRSCDSALQYYTSAAEATIRALHANRSLPLLDWVRISDYASGRGRPREPDAAVVKYYQHSAANGDVAAMRSLGNLYFQGERGMPPDLARAAWYFELAAEAGDSVAAGILGHMRLHGMGVEQDLQLALRYFTVGELEGDPQSLTGLGYMHARGLLFEPDSTLAVRYFEKAIRAGGHPEAYFNLGRMYMGETDLAPSPPPSPASRSSVSYSSRSEGTDGVERDTAKALDHFLRASRHGHLESTYRLGLMLSDGVATTRNCKSALIQMRSVAERGEWSADISSAYESYRAGDYDKALMLYIRAAEIGFEVAQSNAAWLMEHGHCGGMPQASCNALALRMYKRAAQQGRADALLRLGDLYFEGVVGVPADAAAAVRYYKLAADGHSAQAMFNLGWLYQMGQGVPQDFHLSKRHYDMAREQAEEARAPASLALAGMWVHMWCARMRQSALSVDSIRARVLEGLTTDTILLLLLSLLLWLVLRRMGQARS
jgi:SEL1 protein